MNKEDKSSELTRIKEYARKENIPIMQDEGIEFLTSFIEKKGAKSILEVGTAIGYSAIMMALVNTNIHVTTIERDEIRYLEALKNIKKFELENRITLIYNDALNVELEDEFDLIFIDAAKAQYIKFFEKFKNNLSLNGVIVSDNLKFHGLVDTTEHIESRNVRQLVRKLKNYIEFLENNQEFTTTFYNLGDGVAVSRKKDR
jgi:predicted O-methyltransferase YrrM